jgi:hypothetical protein
MPEGNKLNEQFSVSSKKLNPAIVVARQHAFRRPQIRIETPKSGF